MTNHSGNVTVKGLTKVFNRSGADGVKSIMRLKPKSGATLQRTIDSLRDAGKDVTELEAYFEANHRKVDKEYVEIYDKEIHGSKNEIADKVADYDGAQTYQAIRQADVQPVLFYRLPGARGKGTSIFVITDVIAAIDQHRTEKAAKYLPEKPDNMVTPADALEMFPEDWSVTSAGDFLKLFGVKEQFKFRLPGSKGKGASLYLRTHVVDAINNIVTYRNKQ